MAKILLKAIVEVQTGVFLKPTSKGNAWYLQAKHFKEEGTLASLPFLDVQLNVREKRHLLRAGDVLFAAKGFKNFATVYEENWGPTVASSTFLVLRMPRDQQLNIHPNYLAWYLNSDFAQQFIKEKAMGTSVPSISKAAFQDLEIPVPTMEKQMAILHIQELRNKEKELRTRLDALQEKQYQYQLKKAIG